MPFPRRFKLVLLPIMVALVVTPAAWRMFFSQRPVSIFDQRRPSSCGKIWTITGSADSKIEAFVDPYGSFQPAQKNNSFHYLIYDRDNHKLYSPHIKEPDKIRRQLLDGCLPAPMVTWEEDGLSVASITFVLGDPDTCYSSVVVKNAGASGVRNLFVNVAAVSVGIPGKYSDSVDISYDRGSGVVLADNAVMLACDSEPDSFGAMVDYQDRSHIWDVSSYIRDGKLPSAQSVKARLNKSTSAAVRYDISLGPGESKRLIFRLPMTTVPIDRWLKSNMREIGYENALRAFRSRWTSELNRVKLDLPDKKYADCFRVSLAYLMILADDGAFCPGATIYQSMWVRDFAYMADALYFTGRSDLLPAGFQLLRTLSKPDGGYAARTSTGEREYDAPGQAIYTLVQGYRHTGDLKQLSADWPLIRKTCKYIRSKRLENRQKDAVFAGILPPSMSAEDLGKPNQQHYWDDFWAYRGLMDAAYAADVLGRDSDAAWIRAEAADLRSAVWASIRAVNRKHGINYIPNGPEDVTTSAMARGTTCGLWPCGMLDPADPVVRRSFDVYWEKWVAPYNGGFRHNGDEFWPYAGLDLAQCYLELGEYERAGDILCWTMNHDPTGGFYSWPEGMNMTDLTLLNGDMPHGWMCASYILLLRNMLVRESGEDLMIASGVPEEWLSPGKKINIKGFPSLHGKVSYRLSSKADKLQLTIGSGSMPRSYILVMPGSMTAESLVVDGNERPVGDNGRVVIPGSARKVEIRVSR